MHIPTVSIAAALIAGAASFAPSVHAANRASAFQGASDSVQVALAEGDPVPTAMRAPTPAERMDGRNRRREEGATAARGAGIGEGNPVPASISADENHGATRAERRTEVSRANRAGELAYGGEASR